MNLIDESFQTKEQKDTNKTKKILIISILFVIIIMAIIICVILYMQEKELKLTLNGQKNNSLCSIAFFDNDGTLYFPIKAFAGYVEYDSFNGEYKGAYESEKQCYVKSQDGEEVVNFTVNSQEIYKLELNRGNASYEKYITDKPIKYKDGQLYGSSDAIEKAFNVLITYTEEHNSISINTMDNLIEYYGKQLISSEGKYQQWDQTFTNEKAIFQGELVVQSEDDKFAVVDIQNSFKDIIEPKYDSIEYIPSTGDFKVTSDEKVGLIRVSKDRKAETKIRTSYTQLEIIDSDSGLFLAEKDDKYGVIDDKENKKINIEYDGIGIDAEDFEKNNIKNNYLIAENFIFVKKDKEWAVFDKKGKQLTDFKYDSFGYKAKSNRDIYSLLLVPDYNIIIACKDKKYILIDSTGQELFNGVSFDDAYMQIDSDKVSYKLNYNDKIYDIIEQVEKENVKEDNENDEKEEENSKKNEESKKNKNNESESEDSSNNKLKEEKNTNKKSN